MDLTDKRILFIGGSNALDEAIFRQIKELGAKVEVYEERNTAHIESYIKQLVKSNGAFDGVVFAIVHSDFKPLQFVKPGNLNEILNDNFNVFIEVVRSLKKAKGMENGASIVAMSSISSIKAMKAKMAFCSQKLLWMQLLGVWLSNLPMMVFESILSKKVELTLILKKNIFRVLVLLMAV